MVDLVDGPIPIDRLLSDSADESCGATVLFLGTTRRWTSNSETGQTETAYLEYEGYREMALVKLAELEAIARERWPIRSVSIVHRLGRVEIKFGRKNGLPSRLPNGFTQHPTHDDCIGILAG